jgi:putative transposase
VSARGASLANFRSFNSTARTFYRTKLSHPKDKGFQMAHKIIKHDTQEDNRFVFELPLRTTPADESEIEIRIQAYKDIKNACLGEALHRLKLMRESKEFRSACRLPKGLPAEGKDRTPQQKAEHKVRRDAFRAVTKRFKFEEYDLHSFAAKCKNACWIGEHLGITEVQKACSEAFRSVQQYSFGKKGRPRFKSFRQARSIEGKSNKSGIRWRDGHVEWGGLSIPALLKKDQYETQALSCETALSRIIRRVEHSKHRYFVQLVQKGNPPRKANNTIGKQSTCIDVGPSTIAVVGETQAGLFNLAPSVLQPWKLIRRIQRAMDRSRRATNTNNYEANGTIKKGSKKWLRSVGYIALLNGLQEVERILSARRKKDHGTLQNGILRVGVPKMEKLSYVSFQKNFGRSSKVRAVGTFIAKLKRKAENAGEEVYEFSTRLTKCSQVCLCGAVEKKPLSQRQHKCDCGVKAQRDLFSAFLGRFAFKDKDSKDRLEVRQAQKAWPGMDNLLELAASNLNQFVSQDTNGVLHVGNGVRTNRQLNLADNRDEVEDVVAMALKSAS